MNKPLFSKKHYDFLAKRIQRARALNLSLRWFQESLVIAFEQDSIKFDQNKFNKACLPAASEECNNINH